MSAKPVTIPRWANVSGSLITPASGKLDVGWVTGERPPAQYLNWYQKWVGDWMQYLSDGNFSGASTFDNTLGVTGLITATGGVTAAALVTANAGVTAGANQHVTVSGTGLIKHGTKTLNLPLTTSVQAVNPGQQISMTSANQVIVPIIGVPIGARILQVRILALDSATGPTKIQVSLRTNTTFANGTTGAGTISAGTGVQQTVSSAAALNTIVAALTAYSVNVAFNTGTATCTINMAEVDFDQP